MALIVVDAFGTDPNTGLTRNNRDQLWTSLSMRTVGYTPESMIDLVTLIGQTNFERPVAERYSDEACRIKFLSLISTPQALVDTNLSRNSVGNKLFFCIPRF